MTKFRKSYYNVRWHEFAKRVKERDGQRCLKCHRSANETILQVHHKQYIVGLQPWEYALSDCITLCKGCHALEHNKIEPSTGWTLIAVDDLGGLDGLCERNGCGTEIRFSHLIYHPKCGYMCVGSSCVDYLTDEEKNISAKVVKLYKRISDFVHKSSWEDGITQKGTSYLYTKHKQHELRIYGKGNSYALQVVLKRKEKKKYDYSEIIKAPNKQLRQAKELAFIVLMGKTASLDEEKELLRNIYIHTR